MDSQRFLIIPSLGRKSRTHFQILTHQTWAIFALIILFDNSFFSLRYKGPKDIYIERVLVTSNAEEVNV